MCKHHSCPPSCPLSCGPGRIPKACPWPRNHQSAVVTGQLCFPECDVTDVTQNVLSHCLAPPTRQAPSGGADAVWLQCQGFLLLSGSAAGPAPARLLVDFGLLAGWGIISKGAVGVCAPALGWTGACLSLRSMLRGGMAGSHGWCAFCFKKPPVFPEQRDPTLPLEQCPRSAVSTPSATRGSASCFRLTQRWPNCGLWHSVLCTHPLPVAGRVACLHVLTCHFHLIRCSVCSDLQEGVFGSCWLSESGTKSFVRCVCKCFLPGCGLTVFVSWKNKCFSLWQSGMDTFFLL